MIVPHYELLYPGKKGRLLADYIYETPILGYSILIDEPNLKVRLSTDGWLTVYSTTDWDFGSRAVDTPAMVIASLAHDMICIFTNRRLIPWKYRAVGDGFFLKILADCGNGLWRYARFAGVTLYSQLIARWRDKV